MTHHARVPSESDRLQALRRIGLHDAPTTVSFDRMTQLAAKAIGTPIALISVVEETRQWFLSRRGINFVETPRDASFCAHALMQRRLLIIPDAALDARFAGSPLVAGPPYIRAYAGAPIYTRDGYAIGTLCVIDVKPRSFEVEEVDLLRDYALLVEDFIAAHESSVQSNAAQRLVAERERRNHEALSTHVDNLLESQIARRLLERRVRLIADTVPALISYWNRDLECEFANVAYRSIFGLAVIEAARPYIEGILNGRAQRFDYLHRKADGAPMLLDVRYEPDVDESGTVHGWCVLMTDITGKVG